jgi:hypothetical protein
MTTSFLEWGETRLIFILNSEALALLSNALRAFTGYITERTDRQHPLSLQAFQ